MKLTVVYSQFSAATLRVTQIRPKEFPGDFATIEKAMGNAIKSKDHPKDIQLGPKQTFNNNYVDEELN